MKETTYQGAFTFLVTLSLLPIDISAHQCSPFEADVYLSFDDQIDEVLLGDPFNATRTGSGIAHIISGGNGAYLNGDVITVDDDEGDNQCFFDPMTYCDNGFTLSFLLGTRSGQHPGEQFYISSGAQSSSSWGFAFSIQNNSMLVRLSSSDSQVFAEDTTFVYDNDHHSALMHIAVTWNTSMLSLYRDGLIQATNVSTARTSTIGERANSIFLIGKSNSAEEYGKGAIDELLYFYTSQNEAFVQALYQNYDGATTHCKPTCLLVPDNDYPSCQGCNMYVECDDDIKIEHSCPIGYFWSDNSKECLFGIENSMCDTQTTTISQTTPCLQDECVYSPCDNGATCAFYDHGFNCTCQDGYEGGYCEIDINECDSNPCLNGSCQDLVNMYNCECDLGFYGTNCEEYDGCFSSPCVNGALNCTDIFEGPARDDFNCTCAPGYTNKTCQVEIDECDSDPCQNNGTCADLLNAYNCTCLAAYSGDNCERYDECFSNPCDNNGTCLENSTSRLHDYTCHCIYGFNGVNCEEENECLTENVVCENSGVCIDLGGEWNCSCQAGYNGTYCELNVNECASTPCLNGGNCTDLVAGYNCTCFPEYDGEHCEDYNHCYFEPCVHGECYDFGQDSPSAYNCTCDYGFSDQNCSTEDECLTRGVVCQHQGVCLDLHENFTCVNCSAGYDGQFCENDIDDCARDPCGNHGNCTDFVNNYTCQCEADYLGYNCDEYDNCYSVPCGAHGVCTDLAHDYLCECSDGWSGGNCTDEDECITNDVTCHNGGACQDNTSAPWQCNCTDEYFGSNCEHEDYCVSLAPCENNGQCVTSVGNYSCLCATGFTGDNCSVELFCVTQNVTCENNGTCQNGADDWTCLCPDSYFGDTCVVENPCLTYPCDVTGTASCQANSTRTRVCNCSEGFFGDSCENGPCDSSPSPCSADGTRSCTHYSNATYVCECTATYEGSDCSTQKELRGVPGQYRLRQLTYTGDYANSSSSAHTDLKRRVDDGLTPLCECNVTDIAFSAGSVVVSYVLNIAVDTDSADVLLAIRAAAVDGTLIQGYDVDADDIEFGNNPNVAAVEEEASRRSEDEGEWKTAVIVISVLLGLLLLTIVLLLLFVGKKVKQSKVDVQENDRGHVEMTRAARTNARPDYRADDVSTPTDDARRPMTPHSNAGDEWAGREIVLKPEDDKAYAMGLLHHDHDTTNEITEACEDKSKLLDAPVANPISPPPHYQ